MRSYYIRSESAFLESFEHAKTLFRLEERLPNWVFNSEYRPSYAIDFDRLHSTKFWHVVREIEEITGDRTLTWTVLDPHPSEYYNRHFGYFGVVRFPSFTDAETRMRVLALAPPENRADAVLDNSRVVACYPESAYWLMWGERELGIAIFAVREGPEAAEIEQHFKRLPGESLADALQLMSANFMHGEVPADFTARFHANYVG